MANLVTEQTLRPSSEPVRRRFAWLARREFWSVLALIGGTIAVADLGPRVWMVAARTVGVPYCLKYSDVYLYQGGAFQRRGDDWLDSPVYSNLHVSRYEEIGRNSEFIYLQNAASRSNSKVNQIVIRLPVCGGIAQVTISDSPSWIDAQPVWH
ncbi:hypothetical protein [Methylobacterium sp. JK268]